MNFSDVRDGIYKLEKETNSLKKELKEAKEMIAKLKQQNSNFYTSEVSFNNIQDLSGKTIENVSVFSAEFGRTYGSYIGFKCSDGTRIMIGGTSRLHNPKPKLEQMKDSGFYTEEEIKKRTDEVKKQKIYKENEDKRAKERRLEQLKKELEG